MPSLRLNPRLAKLHRTYDVEGVARVFGVHKNTVRGWLREGLQTTDRKRPALILGVELRRFLTKRRNDRKCPTPAGMIYCLRCRLPREPALQMADYVPRTATTGDLVGICPTCNTMLYRKVNRAKLDAVRGRIEVTFRQADRRISDSASPSLNHDSDNPGAPDANAQP